jgi:ATP-dependent Clp protease protease subunit
MRLLTIIFTLLLSLASVQAKEIILTKDNTIVLSTGFSGASVADLIGQAKQLNADLKSGYPIYLFLDTPGGSIQAGLELIEYLEGLNRPVHTITLFAASMGFQLVQHLGKRYVLKYGVLMSHKASGGFRGEFGGNGSQLDSRYRFYLRRLDLMDKQTVSRTNGKKTLKQYQLEYDNELWLNGAEAVKFGYADEVVTIKCDQTLKGITERQERFFGFSVTLGFDRCPIVTSPVSSEASVRTNYGYMSLDKFMSSGGKFGKNCDKESEELTDWSGNVVGSKKADLCLMDESLTLEKIQNTIKKQSNEIRNKKRNVVRMSFSNFVSEL